jgi:CheY-like chemotaxis protein
MPDVVLLDIGLPGMDGYEVCRRLRRLAAAQPFVVALTGYGQDEDRRRAVEAGFDDHAVKPVDLGKLTALLAAATER